MSDTAASQARSLILEEDELREITGYRKCAAQARFLEGMRVPYQRRKDGSLVVGRTAMERALSGGRDAGTSESATDGINWKVN